MDRLLEKDITLKLLAVFLALVLWFQVQVEEGNPDRVMTFQGLKVGLRNVGSEMTVTSMDPVDVTITVRGESRVVDQLTRESFEATINLEGVNAGPADFFVGITVPRGVELMKVSPETVSAVVEPVQERQVPLEVRVRGTPATDFEVAGTEAEPTRVTVRGAASLVERVTGGSAPISVAGAATDQMHQVRVVPVDREGDPVEGVTFSPDSARVVATIRRIPATAEVPVEVTISGTPAAGFGVGTAASQPARVTLKGPEGVLASLNSVATLPVNVAGAEETVKAGVRLELPPEVIAEPAVVEVTVDIVPVRR